MRKLFSVPAAMLALLLTAAIEPAVKPSRAQDEPATHLVEQTPTRISEVARGVFLVDFGRAAFGNLSLHRVASAGDQSVATHDEVTVRFGEALKNGRVDTQPPGSVRYAEVKVRLYG